uniref:Protein FAM3C-like isoform X1 n=1 Tax=Petromyzon marinus TaxID=7757 RepID=A0AAJ7TLS0_PETMA|nr:protein FAM3C-like isoform X1 [Petromyzon marinus]XP_032819240.1 protein FAM3C-like isoform X1 [Petromyzon marinus]XP_032819242.1 protein FAM3C-like isoform X1 [Petromyzon marinus]
MRTSAMIRMLLAGTITVLVLYLGHRMVESRFHKNLRFLVDDTVGTPRRSDPKLLGYKCGLAEACPEKHFAFRLLSGAANIVGPKICLEDQIIMSSVKNNVGRGMNIAVVNGMTGELTITKSVDLWGGDVNDLIIFLKSIQHGSIVMIASFDDAASKLNDEARNMLMELGSSFIGNLGFRDSWVFVGAKGIRMKSPFERHIKNNKETNKYEGWPELIELEGCVPQKVE